MADQNNAVEHNSRPPRTSESEQYVLNLSFDKIYNLLMVGLAGYNSDTDNYDRMQVDSAGGLKVTVTNPDSTTIFTKQTDRYSYQASSDDGTYKYWFFEDASLNWYIRRKHKTTGVHTFTSGAGGYSSVYQNASSGPSGSPSWSTYGGTF